MVKTPVALLLQKGFSASEYINQYGSVVVCECGSSNLLYATFQISNFKDPHIALPGKPPQCLA